MPTYTEPPLCPALDGCAGFARSWVAMWLHSLRMTLKKDVNPETAECPRAGEKRFQKSLDTVNGESIFGGARGHGPPLPPRSQPHSDMTNGNRRFRTLEITRTGDNQSVQ